eukprot:2104905-Rhodomonas_salina.2
MAREEPRRRSRRHTLVRPVEHPPFHGRPCCLFVFVEWRMGCKSRQRPAPTEFNLQVVLQRNVAVYGGVLKKFLGQSQYKLDSHPHTFPRTSQKCASPPPPSSSSALQHSLPSLQSTHLSLLSSLISGVLSHHSLWLCARSDSAGPRNLRHVVFRIADISAQPLDVGEETSQIEVLSVLFWMVLGLTRCLDLAVY